jgi:hypothetical protein
VIRLHKVCSKKCIPANGNEKVSRSEEVCLDRCVMKFNEATTILTKFMQGGMMSK